MSLGATTGTPDSIEIISGRSAFRDHRRHGEPVHWRTGTVTQR
jgi:hypothetical protein